MLAQARDAFQAALAAIVARRGTDQALTVVSATDRADGADPVNSRLVERALTERSAILNHDEPAMCVPLIGSDAADEALFVARARAPRRSRSTTCKVLAAIGTIGGLALDRVRHLEWLTGENQRLQTDPAVDHNLIGESAAMKSVHRFITRVAATDATVLLRGESGTGKELVASAIHRNSARARGPFVAINCAALPDALLESELFGHERGAFTGAIAQQRGRLELADGGTVFLDEIGDLAPTCKPSCSRPAGSGRGTCRGAARIKIDLRVIAATNRDLDEADREGGVPRGSLFPPQRRLAHDAAAARAARRPAAAGCATSCGSTPPAASATSRASHRTRASG